MSDKFLNIMRQQASMINNGRASTVLGAIIAFDKLNYYVNCEVYPADPTDSSSQAVVTGWIPLGSAWVGNGYGFFAPPNIGDVVSIEYQEGSFQNAIATARFFQLGQALGVNAGECWLVHQSGSFIKITNDQKITISSPVEIDIIAPVVNINSPIVNLGNLNAALQPLLNGLAATIFNNHIHTTSGVDSTVPTTTMGSSTLTTHTLGN